MRRAQGQALGAAGFDPSELPYRVVATGDHWRLRDYAGSDTSASLLIVAAPIKRPYIWDLAPTVSAIRYCVDRGLHVYLVEWTAPAQTKGSVGLDECVSAIAECAVRVASQSNGTKPFLIGHSLGGTLAAVFAAYDLRPGRHSWTLASRCAALLSTYDEPVSRCAGLDCAARPDR
jgi:polyhydroxyalkanoate synthase